MAVVRVLVTVGGLAGLSSVMVVMMLAQPRIFLAMSRDRLLPAWAGRVHPRFHTPHISTIVTGVVVAIAAGLHADRHARRARQHRHADGLRDRVDRDRRAAAHAPGSAAPVPDAVGARAAAAVRRGQPRPDARAPVGDVGAPDHLDGDRDRGVLRVWISAEQVAGESAGWRSAFRRSRGVSAKAVARTEIDRVRTKAGCYRDLTARPAALPSGGSDRPA